MANSAPSKNETFEHLNRKETAAINTIIEMGKTAALRMKWFRQRVYVALVIGGIIFGIKVVDDSKNHQVTCIAARERAEADHVYNMELARAIGELDAGPGVHNRAVIGTIITIYKKRADAADHLAAILGCPAH